MKSFWIALAKKAVAAYFDKDWNSIVSQVQALLNSDIPGEQKRQIVFDTLRSFGIDAASWLLYAAIELAYGNLKEKQ